MQSNSWSTALMFVTIIYMYLTFGYAKGSNIVGWDVLYLLGRKCFRHIECILNVSMGDIMILYLKTMFI